MTISLRLFSFSSTFLHQCPSPKPRPLVLKWRVMMKLSYRTVKHESFWNAGHKIWRGAQRDGDFKEGKYIYAGQARQEGGWENSITDDVFQLNNRVKYRSWPPFIWLEILRDCSHVIHLRHASSNIRNQRTNPVQFSQLKSNRFHLNISLDHLNVSTNRFTCYYGVVLHTIQTQVWLLWLETCLYPTFCSFLPSNV